LVDYYEDYLPTVTATAERTGRAAPFVDTVSVSAAE
jgi:hypothetical protein